MIIHGNSLQELKKLQGSSIDSVVTDPPYGLAFMNKKWDYDVPSKELWTEVLRVLKPGGHLLSFGGTRTYHRMVVNIEDAGFEIRDQIQWLYGSGFPKSHNISKGIDKKFGAEREVVGENPNHRGQSQMINPYTKSLGQDGSITKPSTDLAKQYDGYGTALKPANEPICLARKPLSEKTIVDNVLKWGVGGINVDGCRVDGKPRTTHKDGNVVTCEAASGHMKGKKPHGPEPGPQGRFPANIILDEKAAEMLDEQSGELKTNSTGKGNNVNGSKNINIGGGITPAGIKSETGGASRFFYVAKASKRERNEGLDVENGETNFHPTVKPIKLMQYLTRLVTPKDGTVLDPFMGSGTTGIACKKEGFDFVGIELSQEYFEIAEKRLASLGE